MGVSVVQTVSLLGDACPVATLVTTGVELGRVEH